MNQITDTASFSLLAGEAGFDPIEERLRTNVRATIEGVFEEELTNFLGRLSYDRDDGPAKRYRHGHRERQFTCTVGSEPVPPMHKEAWKNVGTHWLLYTKPAA